MRRLHATLLALATLVALTPACGGDDIDSVGSGTFSFEGNEYDFDVLLCNATSGTFRVEAVGEDEMSVLMVRNADDPDTVVETVTVSWPEREITAQRTHTAALGVTIDRGDPDATAPMFVSEGGTDATMSGTFWSIVPDQDDISVAGPGGVSVTCSQWDLPPLPEPLAGTEG